MPPALNVCPIVRALAVAYWQVDYLHIQLGCSENKVKVSKWVELAEVRPLVANTLIINPSQSFGTAQSSLYALPKQPRERETKDLVSR
jgi:hypothetical protein